SWGLQKLMVRGRNAADLRLHVGATCSRATQLCPCGYSGDGTGRCICSSAEIARYRSRLSGPLADRIDLHVTVAAVPVRHLMNSSDRESSAAVRERVELARKRQRDRYRLLPGNVWNGRVNGRWLERNGRVSAD